MSSERPRAGMASIHDGNTAAAADNEREGRRLTLLASRCRTAKNAVVQAADVGGGQPAGHVDGNARTLYCRRLTGEYGGFRSRPP
ncbi:hypothetical protein [Halonotius sp. GCM10025705]|uniref:hypothetical protein n=1 Tax=Halonotius sp. GCM10025705 TaxID=3252678 RepID=UPI00361F6C4E